MSRGLAHLDPQRTRLGWPFWGRAPQVFPFIIGISAAFLALLTAVGGPLAALQVLAVLLLFVLTIKRPEYALSVGVAGTLAGGDFSAISSASAILLLVGACASVYAMVTARLHVRWQRLGLPMVILLWLGFRVALEHDFVTASATALCVAVLLIVLHCLQARRDVALAMAFSGMLFAAVSAYFGVDNPTGLRFEGVSGNPNRMAFGLLLYLPFLCAVLVNSRHAVVRILTLAAGALTVELVIRSGSDQGVVGLIIVLVVLSLCWTAGLPPALRAMTVLILVAALVVALDIAFRAFRSSTDVRTLSGRTSIYAAALRDIARHPLIGSGLQHFSEGVVMERSAHSVVLGLASTGGVPLGLAWIAVLVILISTTVILIRKASPLAAAPAVLFTEQLVQTVQFVPITWAVIAMFLLARSPDELGGGLVGNALRSSSPTSAATHGRDRPTRLSVRPLNRWQS